ncbi:MAG: tRNA (adenosine(37)-N6)-threonylcarbamoyltransferase complex transferase subunit TsaD [Patescibacteria group bacterium]
MKILGIETSCDETAVALLEDRGERLRVLHNLVASQVAIHAKYGGVVPEVAARNHVEVIVPLLRKVVGRDAMKIDAIAVTAGPGLMTSLSVGVETAKVLSYLWDIPLVRVNHLEGHIYSNWLRPVGGNPKSEIRNPKFPALVLIVSGGHTELVLMKRHGSYKVIGATRDDAAGEAFDKVAKLLKLGYPGGPAISKLAQKGNPSAIPFPRPMIDSADFEFSFAGLKTAVLYLMQKSNPVIADVCASFEQAVVDVLVAKTIRAAKKYKVKTVLLGGGVAANQKLRATLRTALVMELPAVGYREPALEFTGDNAAMIAAAGYFLAQAGRFTPWKRLRADANWELGA